MAELTIQNKIQEELSKYGACFRVNVGSVRMLDGRFFKTGLPKGHSDLVFYRDGKAYFIEIKQPGEKLRKEQKNFLKQMNIQYGCVSGVAYSVEDALKIVGLI